jgi:hypothetical protein
MADYLPPVEQLKGLGEPSTRHQWADYPGLGLGPEHIPDLLRMVADDELNGADTDSPEVWAPLHAWRALGQLQAVEAAEPLLQLLLDERFEDDDWFRDDLPTVLGMLGPAVLPPLEAFLANREHPFYARWVAVSAVEEIVGRHPEARGEGLAILTSRMERFEENGEELNGALVGGLLSLDAVEAAPVIGRAFQAGKVDVSIAGDWEQVRYELGLPGEPPPPTPGPVLGGSSAPARSTPKARSAQRRKQAKKARKKGKKKG